MNSRDRIRGTVTAAVAAALAGVIAQAQAQEAPAAGTPTLEQRLESTEQQLRVLQRRLELQEETAASDKSGAPQVRANATRFSIGSSDGANLIRFRGNLHIDGRLVNGGDTPATADTFLLRRVRPTIEGNFGSIFDFRFTPDFAGGKTIILDAYATARFSPALALQVGKFKVPVGLERLQSASDIRFIERAFPTSLVPNRDLGLQLTGDLAGGVLNYAVGYYNGVTDGGSSDSGTPPDTETDTRGDFAGRVFLQPFLNSDRVGLRGLGFGIAGTWVDVDGASTLPQLASYRTPGQQSFFAYRSNGATGATPNNAAYADGRRLRLAPQAWFYRGPFGLLTEYVEVSQDVSRNVGGAVRRARLTHRAWQAQLSWFLTGEEESFKGFTPGSTFAVGKPGWGAWELVARAHQLDLDDDAFTGGANSFANPASAASRATAFGAGVNWYPHNSVKLSLNYEITRFDGGAAGGADRGEERALLTRFAVNF